jgi:predicted RNA binding protein YcfA (HicA-like mRNA interferase family)
VSRKEVLQLAKKATAQGWVVTRTKGGHYKWVNPLGQFFFSPSTPSDPRSVNNIKSDMKSLGFIEIAKKGRRD